MRQNHAIGNRTCGIPGMFLLFICATFVLFPLFESPAVERSRELVPGDGGSDAFGSSVAISGGRAVVGKPEAGSAYIFEKNTDGTWSQSRKLASGVTDSDFGSSVSISGDYVMVGAPYEGSTYIYKRGAAGVWSQSQKLTEPDSDFGASVSVSGDRAIVGDSLDSVHIYERNTGGTWVRKQKITVTDSEDDWFGYSVSISGDRAIVGFVVVEDERSAAYMYERNSDGTWSRSQILTPGEQVEGDHGAFGHGVAISGDRAIVGSGQSGYYDRGSAHIFERNAAGRYVEVGVKTAVSNYDKFGYSVAISGGRAVVAAYSAGKARVIERRAGTQGHYWARLARFSRAGPKILVRGVRGVRKSRIITASVAISGDSVLIGFLDRRTDEGSAYVYELAGAVSPPVVNEEEPEAGPEPEAPGDDGRPETEPGETGTPVVNEQGPEAGSEGQGPAPGTTNPGADSGNRRSGGDPGTGEPPGSGGVGIPENVLSQNGNEPSGQLSQGGGGCAISGESKSAAGTLSALATLMLTLTPLSVGRFRRKGNNSRPESGLNLPA